MPSLNDDFKEKVTMFIERNENQFNKNRREEMAREFGVALSTVLRWADGVSIPHPLLQPVVLKWIEEKERT